MSENKNIQDELNELAPRLAKMQKTNPFVVPDNYFETLPQIILQKAILQEKKSFDWIGWLQYLLRPKFSLSFGVLIFAVIFSVKIFEKKTSAVSDFDKLTSDELHEYIQKNIDEYDENDLGLYCCVNMNGNEFFFQNEKEQNEYLEKNLENLSEEDLSNI